MKSIILAIAMALIALNRNFLFRRAFLVPPADGAAILISGTSSGIGRATCGWLADKYPKTTIYCGIREVRDGSGHPFDLPNVQSVMLDITKQEHVEHVLEEIVSTGQPLIGLINNAGVADLSSFEFMGTEKLRHVLEVNVMGTYRLTQAALPMIRNAKGRIVIVGSLTGLLPAAPLWTAYVASKHALESMGNSLRMEVAPLGVSVSMIEPGYLQSGMINAEGDFIKAALVSSKAKERAKEREIYPHLMDGKYLREWIELSEYTGRMEETCEAMEDAIFGKHPQTRYITSIVGPFPGWFAVKLFGYFPDRLADWALDHMEIFTALSRARKTAEALLGIKR